MSLLNQLLYNKKQKIKSISFLIDPDKIKNKQSLDNFLSRIQDFENSWILFGGSTLSNFKNLEYLQYIQNNTHIPCVLFPGDASHVSSKASAILYLSLLSGRNPEYLIGQHVKSALQIKQSDMEVMPTAYILVDGGKTSAVQYVTNTMPIPSDQVDLITQTALAGSLLGFKIIYLEAGSGAKYPVSCDVISNVSQQVDLPIIVGGGIRSIEKIQEIFNAGADMVVIGNILETNPDFALELLSFSKLYLCN